MKKLQTLLTAIMAMSLLVSCASTHPAKVGFDRNSAINTQDYKTFAWLNKNKSLTQNVNVNPVRKARLEDSIEQAFVAKGYRLVSNSEQADFAISYTVGSREKIKVDSFPTTYHGGFRWGGPYYGSVTTSETRVRQYDEGHLAIDVFDVETHQPAWHGWAIKRITSADKEQPDVVLTDIVNQVVAQF